MNLPNKLTMLRIILVPFFVFFLMAGNSGAFNLIALLVFAAASLTDMLDGKIARRHNLITTFGKLMDPLADKILVMSAMICFVALKLAPAWVVIVILTREFLVTSLRLIAAGEGLVIAADKWGKMKTVTQMIWIIWVLLWLWLASSPLSGLLSGGLDTVGNVISLVLMYASVFFTLLSGFNYVWKNRALLFSDM
ncbi:CDP-diacylglycerol--glycerol-3-phosphate 3-phosphatidyltransferase [Oscillospiraceae bacterium LTW-04]|nr:CDP-diacylglycerol--glycerol-3-phosphate 3-phosphatidyltransferase [Oscillospiraceae bacterium MB24-C1]